MVSWTCWGDGDGESFLMAGLDGTEAAHTVPLVCRNLDAADRLRHRTQTRNLTPTHRAERERPPAAAGRRGAAVLLHPRCCWPPKEPTTQQAAKPPYLPAARRRDRSIILCMLLILETFRVLSYITSKRAHRIFDFQRNIHDVNRI